jgi:hypothetical protein
MARAGSGTGLPWRENGAGVVSWWAHMKRATATASAALAFALAAASTAPTLGARAQPRQQPPQVASTAPADASGESTSARDLALEYASARRNDDFAAMSIYRPGYSFWQHIFTIPDGSIAFGSAIDGRLLAVFPTRGNWVRDGRWPEASLARLLDGRTLPAKLDQKRDLVAALLEEQVGPVLHNPTRGQFVKPNAERYGDFLKEWGAIYERFGVPADIGLAQAMVESGFNPTRRSRARALGFCQWLARNWTRLNQLSPHVIEHGNQTTQASHCAAYLAVLATKYGSFVPALSEHHSGGTNVGRTLINGGRLGADDVRDRYFLGSQVARDLREISLYGYRDIYRTYGPRSYAYAEMVFGNTLNVKSLRSSRPQTDIYAMRTSRAIPMAEIARRARLSVDEIRRFNPALIKQVPARATLYLPTYVKEFGADVSFWHRRPSDAFGSTLDEFLRLRADEQEWDHPSFRPVLERFERRFRETRTEEGTVMATVLAYVMDEAFTSDRGAILADFRTNEEIQRLFERGVAEREAKHGGLAAMSWSAASEESRRSEP